ncbi:MAG: energy-coupling factor transporter transmembrane protein EcfT [Eubacterium sp.]|nr:energy-coupling factor transporter transmembrane protein EcfT [Eubacterium sp.]
MREGFGETHPIVNIIFYLAVVSLTVTTFHPVLLGISFLGAVLYLGRLISMREVVSYLLRLALPAFLVLAVINPLFNHRGMTVLFYLPGGNAFTFESVIYGLVMGLMVVDIIVWSACFSKVLTTDKCVYLFSIFSPGFSLVLSMVFRFVPRFGRILSEAYEARVISGDGGPVASGVRAVGKASTYALERSAVTADSMTDRGYGTGRRTSFSLFVFRRRDAGILVFIAAFFSLYMAGFFNGFSKAYYEPYIEFARDALTPASLAVFAAFACVCAVPFAVSMAEEIRFGKSVKNVGETDRGGYRLWER